MGGAGVDNMSTGIIHDVESMHIIWGRHEGGNTSMRTTKPTALPTPTGDGILQIYDRKIHELNCDSSSCSWTTRSEELAIMRNYGFVAVYIPEELTNCS